MNTQTKAQQKDLTKPKYDQFCVTTFDVHVRENRRLVLIDRQQVTRDEKVICMEGNENVQLITYFTREDLDSIVFSDNSIVNDRLIALYSKT